MDSITRHKISQSMKKRKKSATHRKHISQAMKDKKLTKEHKDNISNGMKRHYDSKTTFPPS